jgi:hypothetical protein
MPIVDNSVENQNKTREGIARQAYMKLWILNKLTLGVTNGSQMRGKNKNNNAKALPNVHAPI